MFNDYDDTNYKYIFFKKYETSIIKSVTGTGKTTAINTHMKTYLKEHPTTKFVSITARQSLSAQHMLSFKDIDAKLPR